MKAVFVLLALISVSIIPALGRETDAASIEAGLNALLSLKQKGPGNRPGGGGGGPRSPTLQQVQMAVKRLNDVSRVRGIPVPKEARAPLRVVLSQFRGQIAQLAGVLNTLGKARQLPPKLRAVVSDLGIVVTSLRDLLGRYEKVILG